MSCVALLTVKARLEKLETILFAQNAFSDIFSITIHDHALLFVYLNSLTCEQNKDGCMLIDCTAIQNLSFRFLIQHLVQNRHRATQKMIPPHKEVVNQSS